MYINKPINLMMKTSLFKIRLFYFLICVLSVTVNAQESKMKPNVLFIICDDLNDYEGVFGGHKQAITPNIDKLAASGVQFINAQSNVPVCQPSRNSLFTGVYPHVSKDFGWTDHTEQAVLKNNKTLMKYFQENGYITLGTGKLTHGPSKEDWNQWGMDQANNYGPFYFDGNKTSVNPSVPAPFNSIGPIDGSFGRLSAGGISNGVRGEKGLVYGWSNKPMRYINDNDRDPLQDELHAQWAVKKLKEMEDRDDKQPFFMGIGFVRPHTPLHAPDKYFDMFPLDKIELDNWKVDDDNDIYWKDNIVRDDKGTKYYKMLVESYGGNREVALKHFLQAYLACVAFVDDQIGVVIDALNKSEFKDNTIVVLTSDHGWQMGEKNYLFKNSPWEESARIPLIIKTPTTKPGVKIEHPVSLIDIFPTLIDYASLKGSYKLNEKGGDIGGYSLRPFLENSNSKKWNGPNGALTLVGNFGNNIAVEKQNYSYRTIHWRYIKYSDGQEELYDHRTDPYEWHNIAKDKKNIKVKKELEKEMNQIIGI
jgi:arylsulfatase A-like enzyme